MSSELKNQNTKDKYQNLLWILEKWNKTGTNPQVLLKIYIRVLFPLKTWIQMGKLNFSKAWGYVGLNIVCLWLLQCFVTFRIYVHFSEITSAGQSRVRLEKTCFWVRREVQPLYVGKLRERCIPSGQGEWVREPGLKTWLKAALQTLAQLKVHDPKAGVGWSGHSLWWSPEEAESVESNAESSLQEILSVLCWLAYGWWVLEVSGIMSLKF